VQVAAATLSFCTSSASTRLVATNRARVKQIRRCLLPTVQIEAAVHVPVHVIEKQPLARGPRFTTIVLDHCLAIHDHSEHGPSTGRYLSFCGAMSNELMNSSTSARVSGPMFWPTISPFGS